MKNLILYIGAFSATAAFFLLRNNLSRKTPAVADLAHKLEAAWADHHTVA